MTQPQGTLESIALIRGLRSWEYKKAADHEEEIDKIGSDLMLGFGLADIDTVVVPMLEDENLGRTAYYLHRSLADKGIRATLMGIDDAPELIDTIEQTRVNNFSVRTTIPYMSGLVAEYAQQDVSTIGDRRLVGRLGLAVVTSEPFMVGAARAQENAHGVPLRHATQRIEPGEVLHVDLDTYI